MRGLFVLLVIVATVMLLGCVTPPMHEGMGASMGLIAASTEATIKDLTNDDLALRAQARNERNYQVKAQVESVSLAAIESAARVERGAAKVQAAATQLAAQSQPSPKEIVSLIGMSAEVNVQAAKDATAIARESAVAQQAVAAQQAANDADRVAEAKLADIVRKGDVAIAYLKTLAARMTAVSEAEKSLLGAFGQGVK